ncbi:hypothetical protein [Pseudoalteromonas phenolica]|uniref:hypothetical protein n=1 Tax=Pseudoalteromonas phenolica TaxID=161398 RepID=UPI001981351B|nr:hypothetical protein [Pseudoalteromonas phenolica]
MFEIGKVYNRQKEIHGVYKGQQYGGISTPKDHPYIFIFTSNAGEEFGYSDGFHPDGTFRYTGEGQEGDMKMEKGNLAIRDHKLNGKEILLFEEFSSGHSKFLGFCDFLDHHIEIRPDKHDQMRNAFIFHLELYSKAEGIKAHTQGEPELL